MMCGGGGNFWPAMAVPMTVKMPEPITAPMPSAVSDQGPSDFFSACSGSSESRISLSMDLRATSWLGSRVLLVPQTAGCEFAFFNYQVEGALKIPVSLRGAFRRSVQGEYRRAKEFSQ